MRLLLIRHGETVHNVSSIYAGITDSALTNHGVLQANRLGTQLFKNGIKVSQIYASDLQRAYKTAEAIIAAQSQQSKPLEVTKLELLREQDFGYYEGKTFLERSKDLNKTGKETHSESHRNNPGFKDVETKESMRARMDEFIDQHLVDAIDRTLDEHSIVIVAHGIILSHLWRGILGRFNPKNVSIGSGVQNNEFGLEYLGGWSNTGYLDLDIKALQDLVPAQAVSIPSSASSQLDTSVPATLQTPSNESSEDAIPSKTLLPSSSLLEAQPAKLSFSNMLLTIKSVNNKTHLDGLKKTRGGLGNLKHDSSQKTMDSFFKKRKLDDTH